MPNTKIERHPDLEVTLDDWLKAEEVIAKRQQSGDFKESYKQGGMNHSFHRIKGIVWMAPRWPDAGAGTYAKVQKVINQSGETGALRTYSVDDYSVKQIEEFERSTDAVYKRLGMEPPYRYERTFTEEKPFFNGVVASRDDKEEVYTLRVRHELQPWAGDYELYKVINQLDPVQKVVVAFKIALLVAKFHALGIIHRDIKLENLRITFKNSAVVSKGDIDFDLKFVDFSYGVILPTGESKILVDNDYIYGSPDFQAPETWDGVVSRQTDIFSLGKTLRQDLGLRYKIIEKMIDSDDKERPSAFDVVENLKGKLPRTHKIVVLSQVNSELEFLRLLNDIAHTIAIFERNEKFAMDPSLQKLKEINAAPPASSLELLTALHNIINEISRGKSAKSPVFSYFMDRVGAVTTPSSKMSTDPSYS